MEAKQAMGLPHGSLILGEIDSAAIEQINETIHDLKARKSALLQRLSEINEPYLLTDLGQKEEAFRLFRTGTWDKYAVMVRVHKTRSNTNVIVKIIDSDSTSTDKTWNIVDSTRDTISKQQWIQLKRLINNSYFWDMANLWDKVGFDGSYWTLVGAHQKTNQEWPNYHVVTRWSPYSNDFKTACDYLITLGRQSNELLDTLATHY